MFSSVLLPWATSAELICEQHALTKVSSLQNAHKARLSIDWPTTGCAQKPAAHPVFLQEPHLSTHLCGVQVTIEHDPVNNEIGCKVAGVSEVEVQPFPLSGKSWKLGLRQSQTHPEAGEAEALPLSFCETLPYSVSSTFPPTHTSQLFKHCRMQLTDDFSPQTRRSVLQNSLSGWTLYARIPPPTPADMCRTGCSQPADREPHLITRVFSLSSHMYLRSSGQHKHVCLQKSVVWPVTWSVIYRNLTRFEMLSLRVSTCSEPESCLTSLLCPTQGSAGTGDLLRSSWSHLHALFSTAPEAVLKRPTLRHTKPMSTSLFLGH